MHVIAAKAVALKEALQPEFKDYQKQIQKNARALAISLQKRGYRIVSGGTDTHLLLVDLTSKGLTGKEAQEVLDRAKITVNKNLIPYDPKPSAITSGIRLGVPAVTTRGMKEEQLDEIAGLIDEVLSNIKDETRINSVRQKVAALVERYPVYRGLLAEA